METIVFISLDIDVWMPIPTKAGYLCTYSIVSFTQDGSIWQSCKLFLNQCFALTLLIPGPPAGLSSYTDGSKTESHEEVEGGTGLAPGHIHAAAAVV